MKSAILIAVSLIIASLIAKEVTKPEASACSDYQIIGRTFDHCITDKRANE